MSTTSFGKCHKKAKLISPDNPFPNLKQLETFYNKLAYFYKGHKRRNSLRKYLKSLQRNQRLFSLNTIYPIRWIDSDFRETVKLINYHEILTGHLGNIIADTNFDSDTKAIAQRHLDNMKDKHMVSTVSLQLDVNENLKEIWAYTIFIFELGFPWSHLE